MPAYQCEEKINDIENSIPLSWSNVPKGTKSLAIIMYHYPKKDDKSEVNSYLLLWNIPPSVTNIPYKMANNPNWYMGANKWLDKTRGAGTNANGSQSFDTPVFRLAETYLIRAEAYGRKDGTTSELAIEDLNVLRKRAAYHANENRSPILVNAEPDVLTGALTIPAAEKAAPARGCTARTPRMVRVERRLAGLLVARCPVSRHA